MVTVAPRMALGTEVSRRLTEARTASVRVGRRFWKGKLPVQLKAAFWRSYVRSVLVCDVSVLWGLTDAQVQRLESFQTKDLHHIVVEGKENFYG